MLLLVRLRWLRCLCSELGRRLEVITSRQRGVGHACRRWRRRARRTSFAASDAVWASTATIASVPVTVIHVNRGARGLARGMRRIRTPEERVGLAECDAVR